jgi:hypothetical protein
MAGRGTVLLAALLGCDQRRQAQGKGEAVMSRPVDELLDILRDAVEAIAGPADTDMRMWKDHREYQLEDARMDLTKALINLVKGEQK